MNNSLKLLTDLSEEDHQPSEPVANVEVNNTYELPKDVDMHYPGTIDKDTLIEQQNQQLSKLKIALEKSIDNLKKQCELAQEAHKEVNRLTALNKELMIKSENFR